MFGMDLFGIRTLTKGFAIPLESFWVHHVPCDENGDDVETPVGRDVREIPDELGIYFDPAFWEISKPRASVAILKFRDGHQNCVMLPVFNESSHFHHAPRA